MDNELWKDKPFTRGQAWIDLLLLANHDESGFWVRGVHVAVKRGQLGYSQVSLSKRWGWSRTKINNFLKMLENEQQIKQQKSNVTTLISIVNYNQYQNIEQQNKQQESSKKAHLNNDNNVNKKSESKILKFEW